MELWNFLGMVVAGLAFALAGGCPGRQLFMAGEGDGDAAVFALGMIVGAAVSHNFGLASSPQGYRPQRHRRGGHYQPHCAVPHRLYHAAKSLKLLDLSKDFGEAEIP